MITTKSFEELTKEMEVVISEIWNNSDYHFKQRFEIIWSSVDEYEGFQENQVKCHECLVRGKEWPFLLRKGKEIVGGEWRVN